MTDATTPAAIVCDDAARTHAVRYAHAAYVVASAAHDRALTARRVATRRGDVVDTAQAAVVAAWERKEAAHAVWYAAWLALR